MQKTQFEDLRVYQLSEELADRIWNIVIQWSVFGKETIGKQIVKSADSIGANIAEGSGRGSYADNKRFVKIALEDHYLKRSIGCGGLTNEICLLILKLKN